MRRAKMSLRQMNNIEALLERLGSLQIMSKASEKMNEQSDEKMSVAPVPATINNNKQAVMPRYIVLDPGWFDRDRTKFKDW